jgi:hypothetical protein
MPSSATPERYTNHRFLAEIISHGVWLYSRFCLSYWVLIATVAGSAGAQRGED